MKVRAERTSCVTSQSDGFARFHLLVDGDELFGEVTVDGFETVRVTNHHIVSVASGIVAHHAHFTVKSGDNRVAGINFNVQTFVHAAEGGTIAKA